MRLVERLATTRAETTEPMIRRLHAIIPDLTPWIEYFVRGMADECRRVQIEIQRLYAQVGAREHPLFRELDREQRAVLSLFRTHNELTPTLLVEHFGIHPRTARDWIYRWLEVGFLEVLRPGRTNRAYNVGAAYRSLLEGPAADTASSTP